MFELIFGDQERLERTRVYTPLGIKFWDATRDAQVSDGLKVTARPADVPWCTVAAFRTASGIYAFQGLPGLRDIEYPVEESASEASPPHAKSFIIEVSDKWRRYLPMVFCVELPLPYAGVFLNGMSSTIAQSPPAGSPPEGTLPGFYLFSAPTRTASPGLAVVRGHLVDYSTLQDAGHAVMEIQVRDRKWYGVADQGGRIAVMFPYPTLDSSLGLSPPGATQGPLYEQQWELIVRVRYDPDALSYLPDTGTIPDLRSIFRQQFGRIWATPPGSPISQSPVEEWSTYLKFGQELVMRTERNLSALWISPNSSPP